jgi:hypothetical protein
MIPAAAGRVYGVAFDGVCFPFRSGRVAGLLVMIRRSGLLRSAFAARLVVVPGALAPSQSRGACEAREPVCLEAVSRATRALAAPPGGGTGGGRCPAAGRVTCRASCHRSQSPSPGFESNFDPGPRPTQRRPGETSTRSVIVCQVATSPHVLSDLVARSPRVDRSGSPRTDCSNSRSGTKKWCRR